MVARTATNKILKMIDWDTQPYKAAIKFTEDEEKAIEVIKLARDLNSIGHINLPHEKYNYV